MNQFFQGLFYQSTSSACVADLTPPTFAGLTTVTPNSDGSFTVSWSAATDISPPLTYEIYILPGSVSSGTLFAASVTNATRSLTYRAYIDSNGNPMIKDQLYTLGVRVRDALNNLNTNTVTMTSTAIGSVNLAQIYQDLQTLFAMDHTNFVTDLANLETITESIAGIGGMLLTTQIPETTLKVEKIETLLKIELIESIL